jgi:hypothetical protein
LAIPDDSGISHILPLSRHIRRDGFVRREQLDGGGSLKAESEFMARIERQVNPTAEQLKAAQAQHRMVFDAPQIAPFDQGNLSALMDYLEKIASLENRRQKAKLSGDSERVAEIEAMQKKLPGSEGALMLRKFEMTRWTRVLLGAFAQGVVLSLLISLLAFAFTRTWTWSPLSFVVMPIMWVILMWNLAPPVFETAPAPKRARKLAKALGKRMQTAGVYSLVARPWMTALVLWRIPQQMLSVYRANKAAKKK